MPASAKPSSSAPPPGSGRSSCANWRRTVRASRRWPGGPSPPGPGRRVRGKGPSVVHDVTLDEVPSALPAGHVGLGGLDLIVCGRRDAVGRSARVLLREGRHDRRQRPRSDGVAERGSGSLRRDEVRTIVESAASPGIAVGPGSPPTTRAKPPSRPTWRLCATASPATASRWSR